ncbi:MAG: HDOD domain-containing protein, partial [Nitrospinales bacterium]
MKLEMTPETLVAESSRLSSLPEIFFMINEVINDPDSSFGDVARVIGFDASLSVRLLKIVNSPFYSFPNKIETITHAMSIV